VSPVFLRLSRDTTLDAVMASCLVALGSNLGDRAEYLRRAVDALARLPSTQLAARSAWHETQPEGGPPGQGMFLNGAVLLSTTLAPEKMLAELVRIESALGRMRAEPWGPRTIDLDLLLYDGQVRQTDDLTLPHPRMALRRFVLAPAAEVAPWMLHPTTGCVIAHLLATLDATPK
jgi:2-amino-4-hydroxy-6-hydroxymethyldihydropteridine diphosphokinase